MESTGRTAPRRAAVLTVSDGVHAGTREDRSGPAVAGALAASGFEVEGPFAVPDESPFIEAALRDLTNRAALVLTTGGTGFGPRDVTPEATRAVIEREAPGLAEAMRAAGAASTPMAWLSRGVAGSANGALIVNLPGSERGALESLAAILPVLPHAVELLSGSSVHTPGGASPPRPPSAAPHVVATAVRIHGEPPCAVGQRMVLTADGPIEGTLGCAEFDAAAAAAAPELLSRGRPETRTFHHDLGSVEVYLEPLLPAPRLVVLGATPVGLALLRWGRSLGYDPVLVEPRSDRVTSSHRTEASRVVDGPDGVALGMFDAVHTDHEAPLVAEHLAALVRAGARFVGLMGSRRHSGSHLDALRGQGLTVEEVARVQTPVGLDIGARTPEEIALSILAGIVAARNQRSGGWLARGPG